MHKTKKKFFFAALLCLFGSSGCVPEVDIVSPEEMYCADAHNKIIGKWKLVGKSYNSHSKDGYVDITDDNKYIEFTKNGNNKYGNFMSNMQPQEAYYIVTMHGIYFYFSLDSLKKSSYLFDFSYGWGTRDNTGDTLCLYSNLNDTVGFDTLYYELYFIKMEDE